MAYSTKEKQEIINTICKEVADGKSIRQITKENDNLPHRDTINEWFASSKDFADQYARAYKESASIFAEDIISISDNRGGDTFFNTNGVEKVDHAVINRDRLRVDSRKWVASKRNPKKYGDKIEVETINDQDKPIDALEGLSAVALLKIKKIIEEDKKK